MTARFRLLALLIMFIVLSSVIQFSTPVLAASIIPVSKDSAGALILAQAMVVDPSTLASAEFLAVPPSGTPNGTSDTLSFFPTHDTSFGILTSGNVLIADDSNTAGNSGSSDSGPALPERGSTAFDVTILQIDLNTPAGANCLRLDFAFYSEEFPEYVGSAFNDAFIAELDQSTWVANSTIQAPDNFAFDQDGNVVSINSTGEARMNDINASGTTYDGATVLLQAATQVTLGAHSLYLSIFDQGDHIYDSAVFVDNIRFETVANPATDCMPGAEQKKVPLIFLPGAGGTQLLNSSGEAWPRSQDVFDDEDDDFLLVLQLGLDGDSPFDPNDPNYNIFPGDILRLETVQDVVLGFDYTTNIYEKTISTLEAAGYEEGVNLFPYPYDWRKDIESLSTGLLNYIDQVRAQTHSDRVDILAHSQGGLVTRTVLARQESVGKVRRVVTLGSPVLGAPKILGMLEYKTPCFLDVPIEGCITNPTIVQTILTNFPSAYQISPGPAFDIAEDPPLVIDRDTNGDGQPEGPQPYAQWTAIVSANRNEHNEQLMGMNLAFHQAYDNLVIADPQVEFYRVIGDSVNTTPDQIREYNSCFLWRFNCHVAYEVIEANGDGTVPLHSADVYNPAKYFDYRNGIPNAYAHDVDHGTLPKDDAVLGFVISYFGGTPTNTTNTSSAMFVAQAETREPEAIPDDLPNLAITNETIAPAVAQTYGLSDTPEPFSGIELEVLGLLDAFVEDSAANLLGKPYQQPVSVIYENIPGGNYFSISDTQILFLNDVGVYTAHLKVMDSSGWRVRVRTYANDEIDGQAIFEVNVPVGAELQLNFTSEQVLADLRLQIDLDADGVIDQEVSPNSTVTGSSAMDQEPPTTTIAVNSNANGQCEVTLTAEDQLGGSGVAATYYLLDGISTEPVLYTSPFSLTCGVLVKYMSVDRAGNTELIKEFQTEVASCTPSNAYASSQGAFQFASYQPTSSLTNFDRLPLSFVPNMGQEDQAVKFQAQGLGGNLFFTPSEVVFSLSNPVKVNEDDKEKIRYDLHPANVVRIHYQGANDNPEIAGIDELPGVVNVLKGNDPSKWRTNLPTYSGIAYRELYPGIELRYEGTDGNLKSTFHVASGVDPSAIIWKYKGAEDVIVDESGKLVITLPSVVEGELGKTLIEQAPIAWQEANGGNRVMVPVRYAVDKKDKKVSFLLPNGYDSSLPLVIDPTISYSTYLGGTKTDEADAVTLDADCNVYLTGKTSSSAFPTTPDAYQTNQPNEDVFVSKLNAAGDTLLYSTYIGGSGDDHAWDIGLDSQGRITIVGETESSDFPTWNAYDSNYHAGTCDSDSCDDVFVTQLTVEGNSLRYSTYLGGNADDEALAMALGPDDKIYLTGITRSSTFPTVNGYDTSFGGGTCSGYPCEDVFVTKVDPALTGAASLPYSTFLGGSNYDKGRGIAIDSAGYVYVTGYTRSDGLATPNAYQLTRIDDSDVFIAKFDTTVSGSNSRLYTTYLGGDDSDHAHGIALNGADQVYVTGYTESLDFPTHNPFDDLEGMCGSDYCLDAFVTHLNIANNTLVYSSFLGGSADDEANSITVDNAGNAYITGYTESTNFPLQNEIQSQKGADSCSSPPCADAFITKVNAAGTALVYSTYLGGSAEDYGTAIVVDGLGGVYVVGYTYSSNLFTTPTFPYVGGSGYKDAFVVKLDD